VLVEFLVGCGVRPEEAFGADWVPLRARTVAALERLEHRSGILFANQAGGRIDINNFRSRGWSPALKATGIAHRRIHDLRHTYATWSLAAGIDIFTLARRMGTSVAMIDRTYGHLAAGADDYERDLLHAYDRRSNSNGRRVGAGSERPGGESG
jgi:integrase